ncbi:Crp/Fnr family transcriptional regulator [Paenibacillus physcomitrellae]|uniref:Catabolite gene activator protein n=1 Tax=Paenibacillus physcomitrellae TaxID=1619311 RepID=A0ABQ1FUG8_9BACL|nr:cyclic nucleotide-binding domain-containing protein [Paenibacillus physcomitrellae]GGA30052.1 catabolite gene activator protein [Paenibacillus physcomitrellae]
MNEIQDQDQLQIYLREHGLESFFPVELLTHLSLFAYERGELICSQGDRSHQLFVLVKGKIKIYTTSTEGKSLILSFKTPLEIIGDIEYIRGIDIINTVEAVSTVVMVGVHYRWLDKYGRSYAPFLQFLLDIITDKFYKKSNFLSFNMLHPVEVRLASYLLSVSSDEFGSFVDSPISTSSLRDAANLIGTSYRHVNRVIQKFCAEGWVERSKGSLVLKNKEGLRALTGQSIYE